MVEPALNLHLNVGKLPPQGGYASQSPYLGQHHADGPVRRESINNVGQEICDCLLAGSGPLTIVRLQVRGNLRKPDLVI
jgi:hypothetical protein